MNCGRYLMCALIFGASHDFAYQVIQDPNGNQWKVYDQRELDGSAQRVGNPGSHTDDSVTPWRPTPAEAYENLFGEKGVQRKTQWEAFKEWGLGKIENWKKEREEKRRKKMLETEYPNLYISDDVVSASIYCVGWIDGKKVADVRLCARNTKGNGYELLVNFGIKLFSIKPLSGRFKYEKGSGWFRGRWSSSVEGFAVFYDDSVVDLINEMRLHSRFEVDIKAHNGSECKAVFSGVGDRVQELINYCNKYR